MNAEDLDNLTATKKKLQDEVAEVRSEPLNFKNVQLNSRIEISRVESSRIISQPYAMQSLIKKADWSGSRPSFRGFLSQATAGSRRKGPEPGPSRTKMVDFSAAANAGRPA
eukprot:scaffold50546_cov13-Tisochrysis_lutea.AAC.1